MISCWNFYALESNAHKEQLPLHICPLQLTVAFPKDPTLKWCILLLLWSAFTLAFYGFLRSSEFMSSTPQWLDDHFSVTTIAINLWQSKTDPFILVHTVIIQATSTSTFSVWAVNYFAEVSTLQAYCTMEVALHHFPMTNYITDVLCHLP